MKKYLLLTLCAAVCSIVVPAQTSFHGYFISPNGDTTRVSYPDYKQWNFNPQQITVQTGDGKTEVLTPENTREFVIDGYDTYVSRRFSRIANPITSINDFRVLSPDDSVEQVHGFLLYMTQAKGVRLYKYNDKRRENFFIEKEGEPLSELKFKIHVTDDLQAVDDNRYKQQLHVAFRESISANPSLQHRLNRLEYKEEKLEAFMRQVEGNKAAKKKMYPGELLVLGGVAYSSFEVKGSEMTTASSETTYDPSVSPVLGIAYFDYSQRNFAKNFFLLQLKWYRYQNNGVYTYPYSSQKTKITYESHLANLSVGLGRNFVQTPAASFYVVVAPTALLLLNTKEIYNEKDVASRATFFTYNILLQTGVRFKNKLGIWAHYNVLPIDVQKYVFFQHNHRSIQVGVDWTLKRK